MSTRKSDRIYNLVEAGRAAGPRVWSEIKHIADVVLENTKPLGRYEVASLVEHGVGMGDDRASSRRDWPGWNVWRVDLSDTTLFFGGMEKQVIQWLENALRNHGVASHRGGGKKRHGVGKQVTELSRLLRR